MLRIHDDADLAHMRRPGHTAAVDARLAHDGALALGEERESVAVADVTRPALDHVAVGDVATQKEQVLFRYAQEELVQRVRISDRHRPHLHAAAAFQPKLPWIPGPVRSCRLCACRHSIPPSGQGDERSATHCATRGQRLLTAPRPATIPTCPPSSTICSFSSLPTISTSGEAESNGTTWSRLATTCRNGRLIEPGRTGLPPTKSSSRTSLFSHCSSLVTWRKHSPGNGMWSLVHFEISE